MKRRVCTLATTALLAVAVQFGSIDAASADTRPSRNLTAEPTPAPTTTHKTGPSPSPEQIAPAARIHGPW